MLKGFQHNCVTVFCSRQMDVDGQKLYRLGPPPERVLLNLPCVLHSVRALESPIMTEVALNWGFAPSAHRLADKILGKPAEPACS